MITGCLVAQSVKCLTLDFSSDQDLMVCEFEPCVWLCLGFSLSLCLSLSPNLSAPPLLVLTSSLFQNK